MSCDFRRKILDATSKRLHMIELRYHPKETSFITSIRPSDGPPSAYIAKGTEMRGGTSYEVTTLSFYYRENLAIGPGSCFFPRAPALGYHPHDIEHVSIYTYAGNPEWVFFSAHSRGQGMWLPWQECEHSGNNLVVYVARNSHACYPRSGVSPDDVTYSPRLRTILATVLNISGLTQGSHTEPRRKRA